MTGRPQATQSELIDPNYCDCPECVQSGESHGPTCGCRWCCPTATFFKDERVPGGFCEVGVYATRLLDALHTIAADTLDYEAPEAALAWRQRLAHEVTGSATDSPSRDHAGSVRCQQETAALKPCSRLAKWEAVSEEGRFLFCSQHKPEWQGLFPDAVVRRLEQS